MKLLSVILYLIFFSTVVNAKNFYISSVGNDNNDGLTILTPWKTITKLNASFSAISAGDSILLKKGESFYGAIVVSKSGTTTLPIVISAYGIGAKPIITGFTTLSGWVNDGGGIWHSTVSAASNNLINVTIDGSLQPIGRYPNVEATNAGYLTNTATSSTLLSLTGPALSTTTNWTGAEVVIRKNHWILDRCVVTSHIAGLVSYSNPSESKYAPKIGYGYFFQNDIRTLDKLGEWFLNKSNNNLSVYFGTALPTSYVIKAATIDKLVNCASFSNLIFENLSFEGANGDAFYSNYGQNNKVTSCSFNNNYNGINAAILNSAIQKNSFTNTLNTAIKLADWGAAYTSVLTVSNNTIKNTGLFAGMSGNGDGMLNGIIVNANNARIEYNTIDSSGYNPITFIGDGDTVRYNYITNYGNIKDDGSGIYTASYGATSKARDISYNVITNGIGALEGTPNNTTPGVTYDTHGIYLDEFANNVYVHNNSISNCLQGAGILLNNANNDVIKSNNIYNVRYGFRITRMPNQTTVRNITFTQNVVYPTVSNFLYWNGSLNYPTTLSIQADMAAMFTKIDSNYYRNNISAPFDWFYHLTSGGTYVDPAALGFTAWQTYMGTEKNSSMISTATPRFELNPTNSSMTVALDAKYTGVDSNLYNGTIILPLYSSSLIFKSGILDAFKADAGTDIAIVLPVNSTILKGSATGVITGYRWTKISGPAQFTIATPTSPSTVISNLTSGTYTFQFKAINNVGDSALALVKITATNGVLPVKLIDFTGKNNNDKIALQWKVASEINVSHYAIERSTDGRNFENIGQLNANNLLDIEINYNFNDNFPFKGINYYRLVMIDKDGQFSFSKVIPLTVNNAPPFVLNSMSISKINSNLKIVISCNYEQEMNIAVADVSGRILYTNFLHLQKGLNVIDKQIHTLNTAVYYVKLFTNDQFVTKSLLSNN